MRLDSSCGVGNENQDDTGYIICSVDFARFVVIHCSCEVNKIVVQAIKSCHAALTSERNQ